MNKNITKLLFSAALLLCCMTAWADPQQVNGFYQLQTKEDLVWFADHVNSGNASANAMLMADIVVNSGVLNDDGTLNGTPQIIWTPIGHGNAYSGKFNGNGHTISGLYFNNESQSKIGLFGKTATVPFTSSLPTVPNSRQLVEMGLPLSAADIRVPPLTSPWLLRLPFAQATTILLRPL